MVYLSKSMLSNVARHDQFEIVQVMFTSCVASMHSAYVCTDTNLADILIIKSVQCSSDHKNLSRKKITKSKSVPNG